MPNALLRPVRAVAGWKAVRAGIAGLAAVGLLAGGAGAQDDNGLIDEYAYQSPAHGYVVEWDDPWVPSLGGISHEPGHDTFSLGTADGDLGFTGIALDWSPEDYAQVLLDSMDEVFADGEVEIVEEGEVDGVYYALIEAEEDGEEWVSYVETRVLDPESDGAQILVMTDVLAFEDDIHQLVEDVVDAVEIDGAPVFAALDETDLENRYEGDEGDEDEDEDDRDDDADEDRDEDRDADDENRDDDETGLIQDTLYVSPSHGYVVRWSDFFEASPEETETIESLDKLVLYTTDAMIQVMGTASGWTPEDIVDVYVEDFLAAGDGLVIADLGVEDGVAYALLEDESGDDDAAKIYVEARPFDQATDLDGEGVLVTTLLTTDERFDATAALAAEEIEIDGNPIFDLIEVEDADEDAGADDEDRDADDRDDSDDEDARDDDSDDEDEDDESVDEEDDEDADDEDDDVL